MGTHIDISAFKQFEGRKFATVELEGLGKVRLASFSARRALEFRKLLRRKDAGEDIELELTRLMLVGSVVDDANNAVFDDQSAEAFMDHASSEMIGQLVTEITKLLGAGQGGDGNANPSQPSPSGA